MAFGVAAKLRPEGSWSVKVTPLSTTGLMTEGSNVLTTVTFRRETALALMKAGSKPLEMPRPCSVVSVADVACALV